MSVGIVDKSTGERIQTAGNPLDKVGDLSLLHTSAKSDAVAAINEVADEVATKQDTLTFDDVPTANSNNPVKSGGVKSAIDAAVSSAYHHAGTKTCAELVAGLLVAGNEGNIYNMTDSGTTTSDFIEGQGQPIKVGDNVGVCKVSAGVYKFDLLSGFVDITNFVQKSVTAGLLKNDGTVNTTIEGDVATLKSGLTNLEKNACGTRVDIGSYTTLENAYVFGSDGYALVGCGAGIKGNIHVYGSNNTALCLVTAEPDTSNAVFVRKGMKCFCEAIAGAPQFRFVPIV